MYRIVKLALPIAVFSLALVSCSTSGIGGREFDSAADLAVALTEQGVPCKDTSPWPAEDDVLVCNDAYPNVILLVAQTPERQKTLQAGFENASGLPRPTDRAMTYGKNWRATVVLGSAVDQDTELTDAAERLLSKIGGVQPKWKD